VLINVPVLRISASSNIDDFRYTLQERIKGPTAYICADGKMSGPSAQHEALGGREEGRRHSLAVGTAGPVPTATVGLATTLGTSRPWPSAYHRRRHKLLPGGPNS
jgi:hypothetical protein